MVIGEVSRHDGGGYNVVDALSVIELRPAIVRGPCVVSSPMCGHTLMRFVPVHRRSEESIIVPWTGRVGARGRSGVRREQRREAAQARVQAVSGTPARGKELEEVGGGREDPPGAPRSHGAHRGGAAGWERLRNGLHGESSRDNAAPLA